MILSIVSWDGYFSAGKVLIISINSAQIFCSVPQKKKKKKNAPLLVARVFVPVPAALTNCWSSLLCKRSSGSTSAEVGRLSDVAMVEMAVEAKVAVAEMVAVVEAESMVLEAIVLAVAMAVALLTVAAVFFLASKRSSTTLLKYASLR